MAETSQKEAVPTDSEILRQAYLDLKKQNDDLFKQNRAYKGKQTQHQAQLYELQVQLAEMQANYKLVPPAPAPVKMANTEIGAASAPNMASSMQVTEPISPSLKPNLQGSTQSENLADVHDHSKPVKHTSSFELAYCPDCEDDDLARNPNYKLEAKCSDCEAPLGTKDYVQSIKRCPFCGSKSKAKAVYTR